jgi:hypothetical protein
MSEKIDSIDDDVGFWLKVACVHILVVIWQLISKQASGCGNQLQLSTQAFHNYNLTYKMRLVSQILRYHYISLFVDVPHKSPIWLKYFADELCS